MAKLMDEVRDAKPAGAFLGDGYSGFARVKQTVRPLLGELAHEQRRNLEDARRS